ncbi:hypothetical protein ABS872_23010, partial [Photorhabdus laumondii]|uniref:hypothetical protein n=1 Tax=Photorhabdus laumondii TaxID=2218628 RepID=UPI00331510A8
GLRIPSVNIPFCGYLTTQGEFTGTLRLKHQSEQSIVYRFLSLFLSGHSPLRLALNNRFYRYKRELR